MKAGTRYFAVKAVDISAIGVPGITGGWEYDGNVSGEELDFASVDVIETSGAGWYLHGINLPVGDGYLTITHTNPLYDIQPESYVVTDVQSHDDDDIYARFLDNSTINTTPYSLANVTYQVYANDDFIEPMTVNASALGEQYGGNGTDLTGWSVDVASTTVPVTGAISITDEVTREVLVNIPKAQLPSSLIVDPATTFNINCQIQGTSPTGKRKTVGKFTIQLLKDYNTH